MTRRGRLVGLLLALALIVTCLVWLWADYRSRPRIVTGPMVQLLTSTGLSLVWETHPARPTVLQVFAAGSGAPQISLTARQEGTRQIASTEGLRPGTGYRYRLVEAEAPERVLFEAMLKTAPAPGTPFRVLAIGDTGDGERKQLRVASKLGEWRPDLIIHTGDLIYPRGEAKDYPRNFFRPYAALIASVPFYPCIGNHDYRTSRGQPLLDAFVLPENGPGGDRPEAHYWFDFADVRVVAFDSNLDDAELSAIVVPWLDRVLSDAGQRWKVVFFHEPIFTHGKYRIPERLLTHVAPVLDRRAVHLVLSGHNHMYERTRPIRAGKVAPDGAGTVYVTTGAGGAGLYREKPQPPNWMAAWYEGDHSFTIIDFTPELLALRQVTAGGAIVDEHHILRAAVRAPAL